MCVLVLLATLFMMRCAEVVPTCGSSWSTVPSAREFRDPRAIAPVASNDIWIVGSRRVGSVQNATGAEHWDGNNWTLVSTPNSRSGKTFSQSALNGADALSSRYVWAVGYAAPSGSRTRTGYETLIERWDGTSWKLVSSPNAGTQSNALTGIDALRPDLAYAVGYYRANPVRHSLILRWNGTSWSVVPNPSINASGSALLDVAAVSDGDVWAVGYKTFSNRRAETLVLHYNGTSWQQVSAPALGNGETVLTSVSAASGNNVWAAGYYVDGVQRKPLTLYYDGATWSHVPSAAGGHLTSVLRDIKASSQSDAWAVGFENRPSANDFVAATQRWDGSSWSALPSAISSSARQSEMLSVAKPPGTSQVWAAGPLANVEIICPSNSVSAASATQGAPQEAATDTTLTEVSVRAAEQPGSAPDEPSDSSSLAAPAASAIEVRAVDKAADAGISESTSTFMALVSDFNNDGRSDFILGRHYGDVPRFYLNDGNGHFTERNQGVFGTVDRHQGDAADVNGDGLKDIYFAAGARYGGVIKGNQLFMQRPDNTFVDRADQYGVLEPFSRSYSSTFVDANGDARPDLFTTSETDRADGMPGPWRLFVNQGGSAFRQAPEFGLEQDTGQTGSAEASDLNSDGWQDLFVQSRTHTFGPLYFYRNNQGNSFTEVARQAGLGQTGVNYATLADVNGDGRKDVIEALRSELRVYLNQGGTFSLAFSKSVSDGTWVAAGDVNGDDRPDIYLMRGGGTGNAPDLVYLNNGNGNNFTQMSVPSTSQGDAESVWPIDYDRNGLTDFVVLNGQNEPGPVQLIAFFPASP
jgi:FG-GAP-like repeat